MKKAVIYWSGTGNTAAMASAIAAGMGEGTELYSVDQFTGDIAEYDKIAFGCPAMGDEVLEEGEFDPFYRRQAGRQKGCSVWFLRLGRRTVDARLGRKNNKNRREPV